MHLYIIRHGQTEFNRLGMVQGSGIDSDLNGKGREEADLFYRTYQDVGFDLLISSTLKRTHQTLAPFIDLGIPWIQTPDLNEISWGEHEGLKGTPERIARYRQVVQAWQSGDYAAALPGGESAAQLGQRVSSFLQWVENRPEKRILIGTHGRTIRCMISILRGQGLQGMENVQHANTGCYILEFKSGAFQFVAENCTRHLQNLPGDHG